MKKSPLEEALAFGVNDARLWHYRAKVIRVIDGDTCVVCLDAGFNNIKIEKLRLAGIDAPEMRPRVGTPEQRLREKELAAAATNRLKELVEGKDVIVHTAKAGKFGRYIARIYVPGTLDTTANDLLLEEGHAVKYGDPRPWRADEVQEG